MLRRLFLAIRAWLVALDQLVYVTLALLPSLVGLTETPSPQETISSYVGRASLRGRVWAKVVEFLIDHLFQLIGSPPGHCRRAIVAANFNFSGLT